MLTRNVGIHRRTNRRSPRDLQAFLSNEGTKRQARPIALRDAELVVLWLNSAKAAKAAASYNKVVSLKLELDDLLTLASNLQQAHSAIDWQRARAAVGKEKGLLEKQMRDRAATWRELFEEARRRFDALNKVLGKYVFRPGVSYFVTANAWNFGMMSDVKGFQLKTGDRIITEGDAVMALVRLASNRELKAVHLCTRCGQQWLVALRSIDRFCSAACRIAFHTDNDEYRRRKAERQREERRSYRSKGWK